jgi:excisionase family DNA binding protein
MIPKTDRTQIAFDILWKVAERMVRKRAANGGKTEIQESSHDKEKYDKAIDSAGLDNSEETGKITSDTTSENSSPEIMTVDQMSKYLQISRPTAYELIHQKKFPTFRIGNAVRISKKLLDQWIQDETKKDEKY